MARSGAAAAVIYHPRARSAPVSDLGRSRARTVQRRRHSEAPESGGVSFVPRFRLLALVALAAIVLPGLRTFLHEAQRSAVVNEIQLGIRSAGEAANQLGKTVTLCAAAAGGAQCADDGNWSSGWLAFVDLDANGSMDTHERRLRLWQRRNGHSDIAVAASPATLSFHPYYARALVPARLGTVTVCDRSGIAPARRIEIDRAGLPNLAAAPGCAL